MSGALTSESDFARESLTMQTRQWRKAVARPTVQRSATDAGPERRDSASLRDAGPERRDAGPERRDSASLRVATALYGI